MILRPVACVLVLAVTVATMSSACSDNPKPTPAESETATAEPTETSRSSTPTTEPTPTGDLDAELLAAAEEFYDTINNAYKTLETDPINDLTSESCRSCDRYIQSVESKKAMGHRYTNVGKYLIKDFVLVRNTTGIDDFQTITFTLVYTGFTEVDEGGKVVRTVGNESRHGLIEFTRKDGRWLVAEQDVS